MVNHEVRKGKKDYKPGHPFKLQRNVAELSLDCVICGSAWFDPTGNGPIGTDGKDQNKIAGVSYARLFAPGSWAKNRNSVLITWRPAEHSGWFEVNAYTNDRKGNFKYGPFFLVEADTLFHCGVKINRRKGTADFMFLIGEVRHYATLDGFDGRGRGVAVGPSFGGNKRSPTKHVVATTFILS